MDTFKFSSGRKKMPVTALFHFRIYEISIGYIPTGIFVWMKIVLRLYGFALF